MTTQGQEPLRPDPLGQRPSGTWPPEVPGPLPVPPPGPVLPSWEGPDRRTFERDIAHRLLAERIVTVSGRLDEETANQITGQLILLGRRGHESVTLHLTCSDSELAPSLALADAVELTPAPVHAVVHGTLRGPAVAVLCAAERRAAHRHALFVLSVPETSGKGTAAQLASLAEQHEHQVDQLCRRIVEVTGQHPEIVEADLERGRLLSAEEAETYRLVEEIL